MGYGDNDNLACSIEGCCEQNMRSTKQQAAKIGKAALRGGNCGLCGAKPNKRVGNFRGLSLIQSSLQPGIAAYKSWLCTSAESQPACKHLTYEFLPMQVSKQSFHFNTEQSKSRLFGFAQPANSPDCVIA